MADLFGKEKNSNKDGEYIYYPEYNKFYSNFSPWEYNELVAVKRKGKGRGAKRKASSGGRIKAAVASVAALSVIAVAVAVSVFVQVISYNSGTNFLSFVLGITNPGNVPLSASLYDMQNELMGETGIDEACPELEFDSLEPDTLYELRISRSDNGEVLLKKIYRTLKTERRPTPNEPEVYLISESVGITNIELTFETVNIDPSEIIALLNSAEAETETDNNLLIVRSERLGEGTDVKAELFNGDRTVRLFEKDYTTRLGPTAVAIVEDISSGTDGAEIVFEIENPYGHTLVISTDAGNVSPENTNCEGRLCVTVDGLDENTIFSLTILDTVTEGTAYSGSFRTVSEESARVTLTETQSGYYDISLLFEIENKFGHDLALDADGKVFELGSPDGETDFSLDGLEEDTEYPVSVRDLHTGETVCEFTVSTLPTPLAEAELKKHKIGSFYLYLTFDIRNEGSHELSISFDGKEARLNGDTVSYMGLQEEKDYTVTIKDEKYNEVIFRRVFTTLSVGGAEVNLTSSRIGYFDCNMTFSVKNPMSHKLTAYIDGEEVGFEVVDSFSSVSLTGLSENTTYTFEVMDMNTGSTSYIGDFTTKATPAAEAKLKNSTVSCFDINLLFEINNPYSHTLKITSDGKEVRYSERVNLTGLRPLTKHRVTITDTDVGKVIYDGSFTTSPSVTFVQDSETRVYYTVAEEFHQRYGPCMVRVTAREPKNPDYDEIWFNIDDDMIHGTSSSSLIFEGEYDVTVLEMSEATVYGENVLDKFIIKLNGISEAEFDVSVKGTDMVFTRKSGTLPKLGSKDRIEIYVYGEEGLDMGTFYSVKDFDPASKTFSLSFRRGTPAYYDIVYFKYDSLYDYTVEVSLCYGEFTN